MIVGVCNCLFAVAMMYMSSWLSIFFTIGCLCVRFFIIYWQCWLELDDGVEHGSEFGVIGGLMC